MTAPRIRSGLDLPRSGADARTSVGTSGQTGGATRLAERAVLVNLLERPEGIARLEVWLRADDFADPQHAAIYTTIAGLRTADELHTINAGTSLRDPAARSMILENVLAVQEALRTGRFTNTPLPNVDVHELLTTAPFAGLTVDDEIPAPHLVPGLFVN